MALALRPHPVCARQPLPLWPAPNATAVALGNSGKCHGSLLLSWYVANFGSYNASYGSPGAVVGFMVWMWLSTIVMLVGAEIDAQIDGEAYR